METYSIGMIFGVTVGIICGLILTVIIYKICNKDGKAKTQYDERQEAIRGRSYKYGMITAWILLGIYIVLEIGEVKIPVESSMLLFCILTISALVQVSHAIWNDAYFGGNNNVKSYIIAFTLITAINIGSTIGYISSHELIVDGVVTFRGINAVCAIIFLVIAVELAIKKVVMKEESED